MNFITKASQFTRVTASGVTVLGSAPMVLNGVFVPTVLTGQFVQLWHGRVTGTPVLGTCSLAGNTFYELDVSLPSGLTYAVTNEDVDLTILWSPAGSTI